jgi:hypothetical protein
VGWVSDDGFHEGYLVALWKNHLDTNPGWREVPYAELYAERREGERHPREGLVDILQVACDCGWRSPRIWAPPGTEWGPYSVGAPEWFEADALALWKEHVELEVRRGDRFRYDPLSPAVFTRRVA